MKKVLDMLIPAMLMLFLPLSCSGSEAGEEQPLPQIGGGTQEEVIEEKDVSSYRIVSYNVGVFSKYLDNSTSMVAEMMKEIEVDAMILNELDRYNSRHNTDQLADFAAVMDWNYLFAKAIDYRNGGYGNGAAWSKDLTVTDSFIIALPKESGSEDRSCVVVEFENFVLAGTHLDHQSEDDRVKGVQTITENLSEKYGGGSKPVFLCGDMNAEPSSLTVSEFKENWTQLSPNKNTYPSTGATKCIDYIFALNDTGSYTVTSSDVCTNFTSGDVTTASDHLPVYVDIEIN